MPPKVRFTHEVSPVVRRFSKTWSMEGPIADIACGGGRHAFFLAQLGVDVVAIDINTEAIERAKKLLSCRDTDISHIRIIQMDLEAGVWPFAFASLAGVINIHYLRTILFPRFSESIKKGGCLVIETPGGQGGNYLELPRAGQLKQQLESDFDFEWYKERKVGPDSYDSVAVSMIARRR